MRVFSKFLISVCLVAVAGLATAKDAKAEAVEFFSCTMAEDATIDSVVAATKALLDTAAENGQGIRVSYLMPIYSSNLSPGRIIWVGVGDSLAAVGAFNDYWESEANAEHMANFGSVISECESSSLHNLIRVNPAE